MAQRHGAAFATFYGPSSAHTARARLRHRLSVIVRNATTWSRRPKYHDRSYRGCSAKPLFRSPAPRICTTMPHRRFRRIWPGSTPSAPCAMRFFAMPPLAVCAGRRRRGGNRDPRQTVSVMTGVQKHASVSCTSRPDRRRAAPCGQLVRLLPAWASSTEILFAVCPTAARHAARRYAFLDTSPDIEPLGLRPLDHDPIDKRRLARPPRA